VGTRRVPTLIDDQSDQTVNLIAHPRTAGVAEDPHSHPHLTIACPCKTALAESECAHRRSTRAQEESSK